MPWELSFSTMNMWKLLNWIVEILKWINIILFEVVFQLIWINQDILFGPDYPVSDLWLPAADPQRLPPESEPNHGYMCEWGPLSETVLRQDPHQPREVYQQSHQDGRGSPELFVLQPLFFVITSNVTTLAVYSCMEAFADSLASFLFGGFELMEKTLT